MIHFVCVLSAFDNPACEHTLVRASSQSNLPLPLWAVLSQDACFWEWHGPQARGRTREDKRSRVRQSPAQQSQQLTGGSWAPSGRRRGGTRFPAGSCLYTPLSTPLRTWQVTWAEGLGVSPRAGRAQVAHPGAPSRTGHHSSSSPLPLPAGHRAVEMGVTAEHAGGPLLCLEPTLLAATWMRKMDQGPV